MAQSEKNKDGHISSISCAFILWIRLSSICKLASFLSKSLTPFKWLRDPSLILCNIAKLRCQRRTSPLAARRFVIVFELFSCHAGGGLPFPFQFPCDHCCGSILFFPICHFNDGEQASLQFSQLFTDDEQEIEKSLTNIF